MSEIDRFDPFNNRLCRNVRNALSEGFKEALEDRALKPVHRMAGFFLNGDPPPVVREYIDQRLAAYEGVLADLGDHPADDPLDIAPLIWNHRLFFETHEYLEPFWMAAEGDEKRLLQALIRAAGAYVHLEQGNRSAARRIGTKALDAIEQYRQRLRPHFDPQLLLDKLRSLDPDPPRLQPPVC
ncbi:DUF309 domain-containing protein [uncultured Desulfosarcina sp.]|uniref:DUF309 domain-containing protein n=1 Tax=uncultured Desulfosarcina sp. TaxID=218289 RepID=UPI0029C6D49B|nr:DUF309 domain-containing protein [uncultured Desulfosarcina sp.]